MAFDFSTLVTDRTQQDVDYAKQIRDKLVLGTATDAEKAEWNSFTLKGAYNHTVLNRVTAAMEDLKLRLEGYGYVVLGYQRIVVAHKVETHDEYLWYEDDQPTPENMEQYLLNVSAIRAVLEVLSTTPSVPTRMTSITTQDANAIEQILFDVEKVIYQVVNSFPRNAAFTFWSGNRPLPSATSDRGRTWEELDAMQTKWVNWQVADWYLLLYGNLRAEGVIE